MNYLSRLKSIHGEKDQTPLPGLPSKLSKAACDPFEGSHGEGISGNSIHDWLTLVPERAAILIADAQCPERYAEPLALFMEAPCPAGVNAAHWDDARNTLGLLIDDCRWLGWFAREAVRLSEAPAQEESRHD
jgi:hypothetical protein